MVVEDALVLAAVLERTVATLKTSYSAVSKSKPLVYAFKVYDLVRRERSQWLGSSSRRQGEVVKWLNPTVGRDPDKLVKDTQERMDKIFYYDWKAMLRQTTDESNAGFSLKVSSYWANPAR